MSAPINELEDAALKAEQALRQARHMLEKVQQLILGTFGAAPLDSPLHDLLRNLTLAEQGVRSALVSYYAALSTSTSEPEEPTAVFTMNHPTIPKEQPK